MSNNSNYFIDKPYYSTRWYQFLRYGVFGISSLFVILLFICMLLSIIILGPSNVEAPKFFIPVSTVLLIIGLIMIISMSRYYVYYSIKKPYFLLTSEKFIWSCDDSGPIKSEAFLKDLVAFMTTYKDKSKKQKYYMINEDRLRKTLFSSIINDKGRELLSINLNNRGDDLKSLLKDDVQTIMVDFVSKDDMKLKAFMVNTRYFKKKEDIINLLMIINEMTLDKK